MTLPPCSGRLLRWGIAAPLAILVAVSGAALCQMRLDQQRERQFDEELLYLPNEHLLQHFTGGLSNVVADVVWLQCIQYTAKEFKSRERRFTWLAHMCNTVVRLDPYFAGAYEYGAIFLAAIGNDRVAEDLLLQGIRRRPDRWELPREMAKLYILNRNNEPGSYGPASHYLAWTAELCPEDRREFYLNWAYDIQVRHDMTRAGQAIWRDVLETSTDRFMRELAARKLQLLALHDAVKALDNAVRHYHARTGRTPASLEALRDAGIIPGMPEDVLGGRFFIDSHGRVQSTTLLDEEKDRLLRVIRDDIARFVKKHGRNPASLDELASTLPTEIPAHPYEDQQWAYDPATGEVR